MRLRRTLRSTVALVMAFGGLGLVTATPAAANPCGFYETSSDAFYNHCTGDGSHVVIHVEVAWRPDYERCVWPGETWLGSASDIDGAYYTGRLC